MNKLLKDISINIINMSNKTILKNKLVFCFFGGICIIERLKS